MQEKKRFGIPRPELKDGIYDFDTVKLASAEFSQYEIGEWA